MKLISNYRHCDFFVLRSPLVPYSRLAKLFNPIRASVDGSCTTSDGEYRHSRVASEEYLLCQTNDNVIREALWLASPGLIERLANKDFIEKKSKRSDTVATLYKYCLRMATRCTPFGLFASCTFGRISEQTQFTVPTSGSATRVTRLDTGYLYRLVASLSADKTLRKSIRFSPNTSLYSVGEQMHYVEARALQGEREISYKLSAVGITDYLTATLLRAELPKSAFALAEALCCEDPEITIDGATEYINELIDNQLLVPGITPSVTGASPLKAILSALINTNEALSVSTVLNKVDTTLRQIDSAGLGVDLQNYQIIADELKKLPAEVDDKRLFRVDMNIQFPIQVGRELANDILDGAEVLHRISPPPFGGALDRFKSDFRDRYGDQEIPLCAALDDDIGIGFDGSDNSAILLEPLLNGVSIFNVASDSQMSITQRDLVLMDTIQKLTQRNETELRLDASLVKSLTHENPTSLPDAWSAFIVLYGSDTSSSSDYHFLLKSIVGPGAVNLLGRFCHLNSELMDGVERCLRAEESLNPGVIYAEIAHMPEGRVGNVLQRPVLRDHEIVYLGKSGASIDKQIGIRDLMVSIKADRIILRSKQHGKEILPRLASAHNFANPSNLRIYRFLCLLQHQGVQGGISWNWGALNDLSFLPRVTHDRMILARASWKLNVEDLKALARLSGFAQFKEMQKLRERLALPHLVLLSEGDNEIPFDLNSPLSVEVLCKHFQKCKTSVRVHEQLSQQFVAPLIINGEPYANELLIPFVRRVI